MQFYPSSFILCCVAIATAFGIAACNSKSAEEPAPGAATVGPAVPQIDTPTDTSAARTTERTLSPLLFDLSTTVSQVENVFMENRPAADTIPYLEQIRDGATTYGENLDAGEQSEVRPVVENIRTITADMIKTAELGDLDTVMKLNEKLRDDYVRALRNRELDQ